MERRTIPLNPFWSKTPPEPVTEEQYQSYLIGKHIEERNAYVLISKLWPGLFDTYRKAKRYLDAHPEIRRRKPFSQRLEVHAGDWFRCLARKVKRTEPTDAAIEAYLEGMEQRKAEARQQRK